MIVGTSTCGSAARSRVGRNRNCITVNLEVSNQGTVTCNSESIIGVGGDNRTIFRPVGESVASGRRGNQGAGRT